MRATLEKENIRIIEALLFCTQESLTQAQVNSCFDDDDVPSLNEAVKVLNEEYEQTDRSFEIEKAAGGWRLVTRHEYEIWVRRLLTRTFSPTLSQAALETLAVVAYKGPASRADVESIRGVSCGSVLKSLLGKNLIKIKGREKSPGRPLIYAVTDNFLTSFGISTISDLPKLREISELTAELDPTSQKELFDSRSVDAAE